MLAKQTLEEALEPIQAWRCAPEAYVAMARSMVTFPVVMAQRKSPPMLALRADIGPPQKQRSDTHHSGVQGLSEERQIPPSLDHPYALPPFLPLWQAQRHKKEQAMTFSSWVFRNRRRHRKCE